MDNCFTKQQKQPRTIIMANNKKQKGGLLNNGMTDNEIIYLLIPNDNYNKN